MHTFYIYICRTLNTNCNSHCPIPTGLHDKRDITLALALGSLVGCLAAGLVPLGVELLGEQVQGLDPSPLDGLGELVADPEVLGVLTEPYPTVLVLDVMPLTKLRLAFVVNVLESLNEDIEL